MQTGAAVGPGLGALVYAGLYAVLPEAIAWRALPAQGMISIASRRTLKSPYLKSSLASLYCDGGNLYHVNADLSISGAPPSGFAAVLRHVEHKPLLIFSRTCGGAAP